MTEDYTVNGDPHQMAYEQDRGTTSCNTITYTHVDINIARGQPCLQSFIDVRKAFNSMHRGHMLKLMEKIAGAGKLCKTRFHNRTYTAPGGEIRGQGHNMGVDAGCPIPVTSFKAGINSDVSLTALNEKLDWAALYSDDRSALVSTANILQNALDCSSVWAESISILYHDGLSCCLDSSGVSKCKKFPSTLIYAAYGMDIPDDFYTLKLGDISFKTTDYQRNLGLNVYTDKTKKPYKSLLNSRGYYFIPEIDRLKSLAYRMQDMKLFFVPRCMKQIILCYFCGLLNFCACLYWCRSSKKNIDTLRYYYAMGLSAVVGETTLGTLGRAAVRVSLLVKIAHE